MVSSKAGVSRISVSLPQSLVNELDTMVVERGFGSRSGAIAEMLYQQLAEHKETFDDAIMAGTINLVYEHSTPGLYKRLFDLQHLYLDEVISSLSVNLQDEKTLEVVLVQGPALKLRQIADKMISCRGVLTGKLQMSAAILPPVHPLPDPASENL